MRWSIFRRRSRRPARELRRVSTVSETRAQHRLVAVAQRNRTQCFDGKPGGRLAHRRNTGSRLRARPSPSWLNATTVANKAASGAGKHPPCLVHDLAAFARSCRPRSACPTTPRGRRTTGSPRPRRRCPFRASTARSAPARHWEISRGTGSPGARSRWCARRRHNPFAPAPIVSVRTTRQNRVQSMTTMAVITECSPVPSTATSRIDSNTGGNAIQISTSRDIDRIDPAAEKSGQQSEHRPDQAGEAGRDECDRQRHPRAEDHPREHVAAEPVSAEQKTRLGIGETGRRQRRREQILRQADPSARSSGAAIARMIKRRMKPPAQTTFGSRSKAGGNRGRSRAGVRRGRRSLLARQCCHVVPFASGVPQRVD